MDKPITEGKKIKKSDILGWCFVLLLLSLVAAVNYITVFTNDDFWYGKNLITEQPLASVKDIVESQIWHYFNWGGRTVAHTLLQFTLFGGRVFSDVCNVLMVIALLGIVCRYAERFSWQVCLFVLGSLVVFNPAWWETLLWQSGAANYLYTTNFVLLFIVIYLEALERTYKKSTGILFDILMVPLGLFAGWSNENMGPVAVLVGGFCIAYLFIRKKRPEVWMYLGEIMCIVGTGFMLLSPGNKVRNALIPHAESSGVLEALKNLFFEKYNSAGYPLFKTMMPAVMVLACTFVVLKAVKMKLELKEIIVLSAALLSYLAMWASPHYPDRATYGTIMLMVLAMSRIWIRIREEQKNLDKVILGLILTMDMGMMYIWVLYIFQLKKFIR